MRVPAIRYSHRGRSGRLAVWNRTLGKNAGLMGPRPSAVVADFEEDGPRRPNSPVEWLMAAPCCHVSA
jgi:hypothetical protein